MTSSPVFLSFPFRSWKQNKMVLSDFQSTTTTYFDMGGGDKHEKRFSQPIFLFLVAIYLELSGQSRKKGPDYGTFFWSYASFKDTVVALTEKMKKIVS